MKRSILLLSLFFYTFLCISQEVSTVKDERDGKIYQTIKINQQTWFAENLAFKAERGCWLYNDDEANKLNYGYIYNYESAKSSCPTGWHLPTDAEWQTLINSLGGEDLAGGKMKTTTLWKSPNTGASNNSKFSATPAGFRYYMDGLFREINEKTVFWSSTDYEDANYVWTQSLDYQYNSSNRYFGYKLNGFSVRCIAD